MIPFCGSKVKKKLKKTRTFNPLNHLKVKIFLNYKLKKEGLLTRLELEFEKIKFCIKINLFPAIIYTEFGLDF